MLSLLVTDWHAIPQWHVDCKPYPTADGATSPVADGATNPMADGAANKYIMDSAKYLPVLTLLHN